MATVPEPPGCYTQARTPDEHTERVREAVGLYLEVEGHIAGRRELIDVWFIRAMLERDDGRMIVVPNYNTGR